MHRLEDTTDTALYRTEYRREIGNARFIGRLEQVEFCRAPASAGPGAHVDQPAATILNQPSPALAAGLLKRCCRSEPVSRPTVSIYMEPTLPGAGCGMANNRALPALAATLEELSDETAPKSPVP